VTGSLLQSALWTQTLLVGSAANTVGASTSGRPRTTPRSALVNQYKAADGPLDRRRRHQRARVDAFVAGAQIEHLVADPRFGSHAAMLAHAAEMRAALRRAFRGPAGRLLA